MIVSAFRGKDSKWTLPTATKNDFSWVATLEVKVHKTR
jgi:hypothetical protein